MKTWKPVTSACLRSSWISSELIQVADWSNLPYEVSRNGLESDDGLSLSYEGVDYPLPKKTILSIETDCGQKGYQEWVGSLTDIPKAGDLVDTYPFVKKGWVYVVPKGASLEQEWDQQPPAPPKRKAPPAVCTGKLRVTQ